jgi:hypothetical protein
MVRIVLGLLKGGCVGAGIGYLASRVGLGGGAIGYAVYGLVGALVGVICGKPIWRQETIFTPLLKALVGFGVGAGLFFLGRKVLGGVPLTLDAIPGAAGRPLPEIPLLWGPVVGILFGIFVELDDAGSKKDATGGGAAAEPKR